MLVIGAKVLGMSGWRKIYRPAARLTANQEFYTGPARANDRAARPHELVLTDRPMSVVEIRATAGSVDAGTGSRKLVVRQRYGATAETELEPTVVNYDASLQWENISAEKYGVGRRDVKHCGDIEGRHGAAENKLEAVPNYSKDWKRVGEIIDRLLFCMFLLAVIVSTLVLLNPLFTMH